MRGTSPLASAMLLSLCAGSGSAQPPAPLPEAKAGAPAPTEPPPPAPAEHGPGEQAQDASFGAIAVVPPPGKRLALDEVPANVQVVDRSVLEERHPLAVHAALDLQLGSVILNDVQSNPLQPDLQYRGFTASPLLGTPQGIAVYQNGVRINDAFGEIVQWDLVPAFAVHEVQLIPGASPLYGQNALGGGIALRMKDGFRAPGHRVVALAGSFGRYQVSAEHGLAFGDWAFYGGVSAFGERGFRQESQSSARHLYADLRQRGSAHELGINATLADTDLNGNGPAPIELLELNRSALFTFPDNTRNRLLMVAADARRDLTDGLSLYGTAYLRHLARNTLNGDEADLEVCTDAGAEILCDDDGSPLSSEAGSTIAAPTPAYDAVFNTSRSGSAGYGGSLQASLDGNISRAPNELMLGASYDGSTVDFLQRVELGRLTEERSVAADGTFVANDGFRTKLAVDTRHVGLFATDTYAPVPGLSLQASARLNVSNLELTDQTGDALDGNHTFVRVNPALGLTYRPLAVLTTFVGYGESSRAPSAIELACADPDEPCRVPNAFVSDPPLEQVVARSIELGLRGQHGGTRARPAWSWSFAGFGSRNFDDILFVAGSRVGTGYFRNAGQTQRIGLEAGMSGETGPIRLHGSYSLLRATFESELTLPGAANPEASRGSGEEGAVIEVQKGDRIPGLPIHSLKAGVVVSPLPALDVGLSGVVRSSHPFRGDEANLIDDVPGYAVFDAHASYWLLENLQLFVEAQNLLDADYETFGVLGEPGDVLEGASDPRFLGPGAPLGVWAGLLVRGD